MNIIMCVKAVPSELVYQGEKRENRLTINPYDLMALKQILKLKNETECNIICLTMGVSDSEDVLISCLAMGADNGILLSDKIFAQSDTVATTYIIAKAIEKIKDYDLIVCGSEAVDGETGQVVHGLAERLAIPSMGNVVSISALKEHNIILESLEKQYINSIEVVLPALIAFRDFTIKSDNISLLKLKQSRKKGITKWNSDDLGVDKSKCGLAGSKTKVLQIIPELVKKESVIVEGNSMEKAKLINNIILKRA